MGFKNKITGTFNNGLLKKKPDYKYNVFDGLWCLMPLSTFATYCSQSNNV